MRPCSLWLFQLGGITMLAGLGSGPYLENTASRDPIAWYRFESLTDMGDDSSGGGRAGKVTNARLGEGREGLGLALEGDGGLVVPSADVLNAGEGFAVDCWVRFKSVGENTNIITKEGEYFIRLDPAPEGNNISFFVVVGGSPEPRVRGPVPRPNQWYHIVATWDGLEAVLWVNGQRFQQKRAGKIEPTQAAVTVGAPSKYGSAGLKGTVDEVKLYNRPLTDADVLIGEYDLEKGQGSPQVDARFEFAQDAEGWEAEGPATIAVREGRVRLVVSDGTARLIRRNLDVALKGRRYVAIRMAVTAGTRGELAYLTTEGLGRIPLALIADGRMHSYVIDATADPEWDGSLRALCLAPSDQEAHVDLDFVRVTMEPEAPAELRVEHFLPARAFNRAGRPCVINARVRNLGGPEGPVTVELGLQAGVHITGSTSRTIEKMDFGAVRELTWEVQADGAMTAELELTVRGGSATPATAVLSVPFGPAISLPSANYVPPPRVASSDLMVGVHYCPLWKQGTRSSGWELITPFPDREPVLGWYDEGSPEVADWEIKWCLEHGIDFFVYCWYRASQGKPVEQFLGHAIHEGLFNARYESLFRWCIMWENQSRGTSGVASEEDFLQNLLPFWIETYFKRESYLKIDNRPLLFIYRPEYLVDDLGSVHKVRQALDKAREACRQAGFAGLIVLGEYRGTDPRPLRLMADEGLDYSFQYCWPVGGNPTPQQAIAAQEGYWRAWQEMDVLPFVITLSMGWDSTPWHPTYTAWRLPPSDFETLCAKGKAFVETLPEGSLGRRMVLLDNWNEFGEGHYIAPHRQYAFGYLDAVRKVFVDGPTEHLDLVPEDVGLGPYDSLFRATLGFEEMRVKRVTAPGGDAPGLLGWWSFDEDDETPVAYDYSGHGTGGLLREARRVEGVRGQALVCSGGCVEIPRGSFPTPTREITVEAWVRTEVPGQTDRWFVNSVYGSGETGFRFGLSQGKLCFAIPKTPWSHHLSAPEPLPIGRWVHVAGTYDGKTMRLYQDGRLVASMPRGGRILPPETRLCLGSYDVKHRAFFDGLLDEVRIWARELDSDEIARHAGMR